MENSFRTKLPLGPTGQEIWPESNVGMGAWKIVDSTLSGPRNNYKILYKEKEKKNSYQFCSKMPLVQIVQEFLPESNINVFAWKRVKCIYSGPWNKWLEKKIDFFFVLNCPLVRLAKNFALNQMFACMHENL